MITSYEEHEATRKISGVSPEAYEAELAWNAAVLRVKQLLRATYDSDTVEDWYLHLDSQLDSLDTGLRDARKAD